MTYATSTIPVQTLSSAYLIIQEIGFEASEPGLINTFSSLFDDLRDSQPDTVATAKIPKSGLDVPICILVELSEKGPLLPRLQHKILPHYEKLPDDILTYLTDSNIQIKGQQLR